MLEWSLVHGSLIAFFILANSFFVAAEFALVSVRETRITQLIAEARPGARTVRKLKDNLDEFLPAVQFGVTIASLALGGLGEPALAEAVLHVLNRLPERLQGGAVVPHEVYAHAIAVTLAFAAITYLEVLLGELVPKSLALGKAERIALAVAAPMDVFIRMTRPAVRVMNVSASLVLRIFRAPLRAESTAHSPEELKLMALGAQRAGLLPPLQTEMIQRALELGSVTASEIMTPRGQIVSLPADLTLERASARLVDEQHSRVPVFDPVRGPEHIIGVVYAKDVARLMHFRGMSAGIRAYAPPELTLAQVMRDMLVIPETKPAVEILAEFQERRRQMAIVVDEYGSTLGLVTAEDVLEQIVGELEDEFDTGPSLPLTPAGEGVLLDGAVSLRDLVNQLRWELPREPGVETLAGFLLLRLGHLPAVGESLQTEGKRFTVVAMDGRRVARVRVEPLLAGVGGVGVGGGRDDAAGRGRESGETVAAGSSA